MHVRNKIRNIDKRVEKDISIVDLGLNQTSSSYRGQKMTGK